MGELVVILHCYFFQTYRDAAQVNGSQWCINMHCFPRFELRSACMTDVLGGAMVG